MKHNFTPVIGIEVHVVLNSKTKMFSSSKNSHNDLPNTNISPIDLGHPGIMPQPNKECIKKGIILAHALNMEISQDIIFDRKNYFYQDLPKGFQITQQFFPIGKNGKLDIGNNEFIDIERIHLEEDTAKQTIEDGKVLLDYNRAGLPLIEIVTKPCIKNSKQAAAFLKALRRILVFNNISDAKLEEGSMRADINISVMPIGSKQFGTRVEIKNINSISNVEKAIEFEINRQINTTLSVHESVQQETRRFDDKTFSTVFMRLKTNAVDYHYMCEPNIHVRRVDDKFIKETIKDNYVNIHDIISNLEKEDVSNEFINLLMDDYDLFKVFNQMNKVVNNANEVVKWLCVELVGLISKDNKSINNIETEKINNISNMIKMLLDKKINGKQAKEILKFIYETNDSLEDIIEKNNFKQITDEKVIANVLVNYLNQNKKMLDQYNDRPERVEKFFIGMVMKDTNGQANPEVTTIVFNKFLKIYQDSKNKENLVFDVKLI